MNYDDEGLKIGAHVSRVQGVAKVKSDTGRSQCGIESESQAGSISNMSTGEWFGGSSGCCGSVNGCSSFLVLTSKPQEVAT